MTAAFARQIAEKRGLLPGETDWTYVRKREAQEIVPRVYLGPYEAAKNEEHLRNLGISHCIIFRSPEESRIIKKKFEQWIQYEVIECSDTANQNLIPLFPMVKEAVDKVLGSGHQNRILLQGTVGMSRSAAFAAAYVMETYDLPWDASVHYVSTRRNCVSLNENFRLQLREYEAIWKTRKRQMEEAMNPNEAGNNVSVFSPQANVGIRNGAGVVNVNVNPVPGFGMPAVTGLVAPPGGAANAPPAPRAGVKRRLEEDDHEYERVQAPAPIVEPAAASVAMENG
mmetsp:Transcript_10591/g.25826  ORF Transcript_10591/g.25826 Transcript_10591/m.25826 type:complete len:283 (+) Transcript_10591:141-989(+)|eukprot:CAMPEP_0178995502 /NCGR_PEP_ID=MMETSP0795-20121207/7860_1 /TAXON_ID=88552 /ORGANISM="Amoebophrya sp., Strain Ameob2" /LENGTH=282 /DNA_ID=CAMNT_0020687811 /DNA_START=77 /DNA_END=925 /DNA_ORIENTATION=-